MAGARFGPYELLSPAGAGGMGELWKARDTRVDRIVAIKIWQRQFSERFEREARATAVAAAMNLGIPLDTICIESPAATSCSEEPEGKGQPVIGAGVLFKGRAAEKLTDGLPRRPCRELTIRLHEEMETPERIHLDRYGYLVPHV